jgi:hypothetical protein
METSEVIKTWSILPPGRENFVMFASSNIHHGNPTDIYASNNEYKDALEALVQTRVYVSTNTDMIWEFYKRGYIERPPPSIFCRDISYLKG